MSVTKLALVKREPSAAVVEELEELLARARSGELISFMASFELMEGKSGWVFAGGKGHSKAVLIGQMELAKMGLPK